jgi:DNA (cytosine-5)-methyltransferase 1
MLAGVPSRARPLLVADLFCGAGGTSTGARRALAERGLRMELVAVNHWPVAIETHRRNHPEARHYCQDVATLRPVEAVPEGRLDVLMASPTCTHHSRARGGKPTSDQQRMDPWHVVTWLTELRVKALLVENVPEFVDWGPVDARTGRPLKSRRGEYFRAWAAAIEALGFRLAWRIVNAADHGDATTRARFFMVAIAARAARRAFAWPHPTHSRDGGADLLGGRRRWRPAREIIDWSIAGKSIFRRKTPLSPRTLARIYAGAVKFRWPEPFIVVLRNHMSAQGIDAPLPTITAGGTHLGLAQPVPLLVRADMMGAKTLGARSVDDPAYTVLTSGGIGVVEPFILNRHGDNGAPRAHSVAGPVPTVTTRGAGYVVEPFVLSRHAGGAPRSVEEPTPCQVAKHSHVLIAPYYGSGSGESCGSAEQPLPTVTTKARFGMVVPVTHGGDASNRARDLDQPIPTVTTAPRGELAFITPAIGEHEGRAPRLHDLGEPGPGVDILFRMLEPHELARAMGFEDAETRYEFAGNKTEVTRQIGNAVPVNTAAALVGAIVEAIRA